MPKKSRKARRASGPKPARPVNEGTRRMADAKTTAEPRERSGVPQSPETRATRVGQAIKPGPRKERPKGGPGRRWSNHKRRAVWFQSRAAWPVREPPVKTLVAERDRVHKELQ